MGLGVELVAGQRPELEVSPAMVAFGEMMHLPSQAIDSLIQDELRANPALQRLDPVECPICRGSWQRSCPVCSRAPHRAGGAVTDRAFQSGSIDFPVPTSDADTLLSEVRVALRPVQRPIAEYLVGNLDQHGLLDQPIAAMAAELGVDDDELAAVLGVIRECGPPGLAATSVSECLQLQLERLPGVDGELRRLAGAVIESHLPALGKGQLTAIASRLGVQRSMIEEVQQLIRDRLRPRPAFNGPAGTPNRYIVPDLVIRENEIGTFTVQVVEPMRHRLRVISPHPATGGSGSGQLRDFVHAAQSLLTQLHDRWQTLQRVADCTVHRQQEFLRHGPSARKPLTRRDIATELGLHESTVSRAVAGKYALLPSRRLIPMDAFFGVSGGLDAELRRLIESEQRPLSDQEIADRLGAQGYQVARRTVAKHRIQLGIGSATQR